MLRLVCESKEATSLIAEVLELMSANAHKQVFQSSVSSFLRLKYVGKLKKPFVYSYISVSYTCFSIVCVFVFTFHVRRKAQNAIRLLKHQCFLYMFFNRLCLRFYVSCTYESSKRHSFTQTSVFLIHVF